MAAVIAEPLTSRIYTFDFTVVSGSKAIEGATISFLDTILNQQKSLTTNAAGKASYQGTLPPNLNAGTYTFNFNATKNGFPASPSVSRQIIIDNAGLGVTISPEGSQRLTLSDNSVVNSGATDVLLPLGQNSVMTWLIIGLAVWFLIKK